MTEWAKWWPWIGGLSAKSGLFVVVAPWLASASGGSECGERRVGYQWRGGTVATLGGATG